MNKKLIIALGGSPGMGIQKCIQIEEASGIQVARDLKFRLHDFQELVFYENSNKNFVFFVSILILRFLGFIKDKEIKYFHHGDHFLPLSRSNYGKWVLIRELLFLKLSGEVISHSFTSLAIIHKMLNVPRSRLHRKKFNLSAYIISLSNPVVTASKSAKVCVVQYKRKNKNRHLTHICNRGNCVIFQEGDPNLHQKIALHSEFAICSESESLSLIAIEATHNGATTVYINKRIGIKEYADELRDSFPHFQGFSFY